MEPTQLWGLSAGSIAVWEAGLHVPCSGVSLACSSQPLLWTWFCQAAANGTEGM
jgi:hypothetical protein